MNVNAKFQYPVHLDPACEYILFGIIGSEGDRQEDQLEGSFTLHGKT